MKASELRIGNWVDLYHEEYEYESFQFDFNMGWNMDYINPIQLTEEWLLKFGFYAKHHHDNFSFNGFEISSSQRRIDTNERSVFYLMLTEDSKFNIRIEHVHQLQNLYFALTGEELIIKEL